jgi:hypothetical protein
MESVRDLRIVPPGVDPSIALPGYIFICRQVTVARAFAREILRPR